MDKTRALTLAGLVACTQLSGCFFVFIPGSLIAKAGDAITGAEGDHCVPTAAKVGDQIMLPGGSTGTIMSLSGTKSRCKDEARPIRARIE